MEDALNPRLRVAHLSVRRFRLRPLRGKLGSSDAIAGAPPLLAVEDLHVWFDLEGGGELHDVQGVDFELRAGERMGLVGESGCGKTTAILALMGLLPRRRASPGQALFDGEDILAAARTCRDRTAGGTWRWCSRAR